MVSIKLSLVCIFLAIELLNTQSLLIPNPFTNKFKKTIMQSCINS